MSSDSSDLLRQRAYELAYEQWLAGMPPEEVARLRALKLHVPIRDPHRGTAEEDDSQDREIEDMGHEVPSESEFAEIESAFSASLRWAAAASSLVGMGQRLAIVLHAYRPALIEGLAIEIERELVKEFASGDVADVTAPVGDVFGAVFEWIRRGTSLSQWGERLLAASYVVQPGAVGEKTLEALGMMSQKSRQAVSRLVQDFRDTFGGVKSVTMREDRTRLKCKLSQGGVA